MTKAQKIILLAAATLIIYLIIFPLSMGVWVDDGNGHIVEDTVTWGPVFGIVIIAIVAFLAAEKKPPAGKE